MDSSDALTAERKDQIQAAYRSWLEARGFRPRRGQREMIAQVARSFGGAAPRIAVIEAGTGTGKTAAYCLAAVPLAQALGKRVVISTATVALQEQVVFRDLPDLRDHTNLDFSLTLAKGRGRYVCLKRLDDRLRGEGQAQLALAELPGPEAVQVYEQMLDRFGAGKWNGEIDSWDEGVEPAAWSAVTTDHRGCTNNRCTFFQECPFFRARRTVEDADVIVANHDLVLADLALGGGVVLPETEETIFILDEAHHFPERAQQHFTDRARLRGATQWLEQAGTVAGTCTQRFGRPGELVRLAAALTSELETAGALVAQVEGIARQFEFVRMADDRAHHRFALGRVPEELAEPSGALAGYLDTVAGRLETLHGYLEEASVGERRWERAEQAEDWLGVAGQLAGRATSDARVFRDYARAATQEGDSSEEPRFAARWVARLGFEVGEDLEVVSAPLDPGQILAEALWNRCYGALCTSATLRAMGTFDRFIEKAGLPEDTDRQFVPSPFDFARLAAFHVPAMTTDPRDAAAHTEEITRLLPELLALEQSALVLFSRGANCVVCEALRGRRRSTRVQGARSKQALEAHRAAVDRRAELPPRPRELRGGHGRTTTAAMSSSPSCPSPFRKTRSTRHSGSGSRARAESVLRSGGAAMLVQACGRLIRHGARSPHRHGAVRPPVAAVLPAGSRSVAERSPRQIDPGAVRGGWRRFRPMISAASYGRRR